MSTSVRRLILILHRFLLSGPPAKARTIWKIASGLCLEISTTSFSFLVLQPWMYQNYLQSQRLTEYISIMAILVAGAVILLLLTVIIPSGAFTDSYYFALFSLLSIPAILILIYMFWGGRNPNFVKYFKDEPEPRYRRTK